MSSACTCDNVQSLFIDMKHLTRSAPVILLLMTVSDQKPNSLHYEAQLHIYIQMLRVQTLPLYQDIYQIRSIIHQRKTIILLLQVLGLCVMAL